MNASERLRTLMEQRGWTQKDLERYSGVSQPTISRILLNEAEDSRASTLLPIARALGVTIEELMTGKKPRSSTPTGRETKVWQAPKYLPPGDSTVPEPGLAKIPLIASTSVQYGYHNIPTEALQGYVLVASQLLKDHTQIIAVILAADDDSMTPVINPGDTVFVDIGQATAKRLIDQLCVLEVDGDLVARWLRKTDNGYYLEMANKELERRSGPTLGKAEDLQLVGKIIGAWRIFSD